MTTDHGFQRMLVAHAGPGAFAPMARSMMAKLGYQILDPEAFAEAIGNDAVPDLLLVDEQNLEAVASGSGVPIIAMVGRAAGSDPPPGVTGVVRRPASLHGLYRLVQEVLEDHPRATPRVPTQLSALCRFRDGARRVPVRSLSQNGCLIAAPDVPALGTVFDMHLELPEQDPVTLAAEVGYTIAAGTGLIFCGMSVASRYAIAAHVTSLLRQR
jgi:hypothetical protein